MKKDDPEMRKEIHDLPPRNHSGKLDEAVKSVYRRYGNNLTEFFRDAYKEAARKNAESESSKDNREVCAL